MRLNLSSPSLKEGGVRGGYSLLITYPYQEIFKSVYYIRNIAIVLVIFIAIIIIVFSHFIAKHISKPIIDVAKTADTISSRVLLVP